MLCNRVFGYTLVVKVSTLCILFELYHLVRNLASSLFVKLSFLEILSHET